MTSGSQNPFYRMAAGTPLRQLTKEALATGKLFYDRAGDLWHYGPYNARTARDVMSVARKKYALETVAEQRAKLNRDREGLRRSYALYGGAIPSGGFLSDETPRAVDVIAQEQALARWEAANS